MIPPVVSTPISATNDKAMQICLHLVLQAEKTVDLMSQISNQLSRNPIDALYYPCAPVSLLAQKIALLLRQNKDMVQDLTVGEKMLHMARQVEQSIKIFCNIITLSIEQTYLICLRKNRIEYLKKTYHPFKPPY